MKPGKLSELILGRSVLKKIDYKRKEVIKGAKTGGDAAVLMGDGRLVTAAAVQTFLPGIGMDEKEELRDAWFARSALTKSINNICVEHARPCGVMLTLILPESFEESRLKKMMDVFATQAAGAKVQILGGHTEVSPYVTAPVCSVTAYGYAGEALEPENTHGLEIVMAGEMGLEGTGLMAAFQEEVFKERFTASYLENAKKALDEISVRRMTEIADRYHCVCHDLSGTGVFGALWELGEKLHTGMEIRLKDIPVRQETIELSEYLEINPYTMPSCGALLIAVENGAELVREYEKAQIPAALIGRTTKEKARVVINHEEQRFLEQPR